MVEIKDVTQEELEKKERGRLEVFLMEEYFRHDIDRTRLPVSIYVYKDGKRVVEKTVGAKKMTVYNENFLSQAKKFGEEYEKKFKIKDFKIETDYSK